MDQSTNVSEQIAPVIGNRGRHRHDVPNSPLLDWVQKWLVHHSLRLVHGPAEVGFDKDELVVLVVLRDGRPYIKSFVEHYFALGAKHLVFLDNGSEDGTIEALRQYESGVTIFETGLPFKQYQISMRQYLVERFGRRRWTLSVDIDELFDYPFSDVVSLKALLAYLNERRYTAVVAQMLDMFPEEISSDNPAVGSDEPLKTLYRYYDTSNVSTYDYALAKDHLDNEISNGEIKMLQGGVQRRLFNLAPMLTKHPLVFLEDGVRPVDMSEHWVGGARLADFTGLLMHYKLSASLYGLVRREVEKRTYPNRYGKYDKYLRVLEGSSTFSMKDEASKEFQSMDELLGSEFMVVSEDFMKLVERESGDDSSETSTERLTAALLSAGSEARRMAVGESRWLLRQAEGRANRAEGRANRAEDRAERLKTRTERLESRAREAEGEARQAGEEVREAWGQLWGARKQLRSLEAQISDLQASRAWKVIETLSRVKNAALKVRARLSRKADVTQKAQPETRPSRQPAQTDSQATAAKPDQAREPRRSGKPGQKKKPREKPAVFFIVGSGKSGTTWLMRMLNAHPEILCMGEGRLFNRTWHREDLEKDGMNVPPRSLYGALYASRDLRLWLERSLWGRPGDVEDLTAKMTRTAIDHFFGKWLAKTGKKMVGDKTPFLPGANVIEEISKIYPEAKVIHIIRDGRDVEVSWVHHRWNRSTDRGGVQVLTPGEIERRKAYENGDVRKLAELGMFESEELHRRAGVWREQVGVAAETGPDLLGENYAEVRYEDMLEDAALELKRLLEFLGARSDEETIHQCVRATSFEALSGGRHRGQENPANFYRKGVAGDWKNAFTEKDKRVYKAAAGDLLVKFGYEKDADW